MLRPLATAATAFATVLALSAPASAAGNGMTHQVVDATGGSFTCAGTAITVIGGSLAYDYHLTTSGDGVVRDNGHGTPRDVVLTDPAGNIYHLIGAFSFTDTYDPTTGQTVAGAVSDQLAVVRADGTIAGRVGLVEHLGRDGTLRTTAFGSCADNN